VAPLPLDSICRDEEDEQAGEWELDADRFRIDGDLIREEEDRREGASEFDAHSLFVNSVVGDGEDERWEGDSEFYRDSFVVDQVGKMSREKQNSPTGHLRASLNQCPLMFFCRIRIGLSLRLFLFVTK
jgi:hypothetical protein